MRRNQLLRRLLANEVPVGLYLQSGDLFGARAAGDSGVDFIFLDMEHEGFSFPGLLNTLQWLVSPRQIVASGDALTRPAPLVRIPADAHEGNEWLIKQTLDAGAFGVIVPRVRRAEDADRLIRAARYPQGPDGPEPQGHRGFCPGPAGRYWGCQTVEEYVAAAELWPLGDHGETLMIMSVEDREGFANIDEIAAVPGVGGVLFGALDGGMSLGSLDPELPELIEARQHVASACRKAGVPAGTVALASDEYRRYVSEGFDFIVLVGPALADFGQAPGQRIPRE